MNTIVDALVSKLNKSFIDYIKYTDTINNVLDLPFPELIINNITKYYIKNQLEKIKDQLEKLICYFIYKSDMLSYTRFSTKHEIYTKKWCQDILLHIEYLKNINYHDYNVIIALDSLCNKTTETNTNGYHLNKYTPDNKKIFPFLDTLLSLDVNNLNIDSRISNKIYDGVYEVDAYGVTNEYNGKFNISINSNITPLLYIDYFHYYY